MFLVDFGGLIGVQEVKVCNTKKDPQQEGIFHLQQLLFGSMSTNPEETCVTNGDGHMSLASKYDWA